MKDYFQSASLTMSMSKRKQMEPRRAQEPHISRHVIVQTLISRQSDCANVPPSTTIHRFAYIIPVCMKYTHYTRILGCFFLLCQPTHYSDGMPGLGSVPTGASATTFFCLTISIMSILTMILNISSFSMIQKQHLKFKFKFL